MNLRCTFNHAPGTPSLVRYGALWPPMVLIGLMLSGHVASASQTCADLLETAKHSFDLNTCRPAPVGTQEKSLVLKSLPTDGEVTQLTESERRKLRDLNAVLHLHERDGVYELKVISVPQAWTGLHERAVLLISRTALGLLSSEELQALVAHEIGHEYLWKEYAVAQGNNDTTRLRELELACDAIAVLTLERIGVKPDRLTIGLEKVWRFNHERFGWATNESSYPSLKAR